MRLQPVHGATRRAHTDLRRGAHVIGGIGALRGDVREVDLLVVGGPRVEGARYSRAEGVAVHEIGREPALDVLLWEEAEDLVAKGGVPGWPHVRETDCGALRCGVSRREAPELVRAG